jgi:hypothetical protein
MRVVASGTGQLTLALQVAPRFSQSVSGTSDLELVVKTIAKRVVEMQYEVS